MPTEKYTSEADQCMPENQLRPSNGSEEGRVVLIVDPAQFAGECCIRENHIVVPKMPTGKEHTTEQDIMEIDYS